MLADYVIHTHPCEEALAQSEIGRAGFEARWFATREEYRTKTGRRTLVTSLFPSYIFATFDIVANQYWRAIATMRGVRRILGESPLKPQALRRGALADIQARFDAGEFKRKPTNGIGEGDKVFVDSDKIGVCQLSRGKRIEILMEYFGGPRVVRVSAERITPYRETFEPFSLTSRAVGS